MGKSKKSFFILGILLLLADAAFCQGGGLGSAKNLLENVKSALTALSVLTVTIAILWVGYKVLFGGQTLRECAPIIIGAILIAGASEIATLLIPQ
ncbi:MAG: TrbC/VirB2 family protein [Campylobacteraceae bacterium]|jgi:type IV secretion system protein VirB2|nr:TrbC/VirB2 family protein [Campylobacteraceae bacterium]